MRKVSNTGLWLFMLAPPQPSHRPRCLKNSGPIPVLIMPASVSCSSSRSSSALAHTSADVIPGLVVRNRVVNPLCSTPCFLDVSRHPYRQEVVAATGPRGRHPPGLISLHNISSIKRFVKNCLQPHVRRARAGVPSMLGNIIIQKSNIVYSIHFMSAVS